MTMKGKGVKAKAKSTKWVPGKLKITNKKTNSRVCLGSTVTDTLNQKIILIENADKIGS